jgi:hypothetical protein
METMAERYEEEGSKKGKVLDTSLLIEGKRGLTPVFCVIEHPPALEQCIILWPDQFDYSRAVDLACKLRAKGTPIGCTDILIASMCMNRNMTLYTKDNDFKAVKAVEASFKVKII